MESFGGGAFGQIFDDATGHRTGIAERIDQLARRKTERGADAGGGANGAEHRGRMKSGFVRERRRDQTQAAHGFDADGDAEKHRLPVALVPFAGGQHRRHDHRAGMDRATFEGVVEILAMDRGAVDQSRCGGGQRARVPDRGARAIVVARREHAFDVVLVARRDGEPDPINQQLLAFAPHRLRQLKRGDALRQCFGDGGLGEGGGSHACADPAHCFPLPP